MKFVFLIGTNVGKSWEHTSNLFECLPKRIRIYVRKANVAKVKCNRNSCLDYVLAVCIAKIWNVQIYLILAYR